MTIGMIVANWIVAGCTVAALLIAAWQLRASTMAAGQAYARQAWAEYLRLGLSNPDLGEEKFAISYFKLKSAEELISGNSIESQRYLWFVSILLEASENLLLYFPTNYWKETVSENVGYHKNAIRLIWEEERKTYSKTLVSVVEKIIYSPNSR